MKAKYFDGAGVKNIPMSWDSNEGWTIAGDAKITDKDLYYKVAAVYRAAQISAVAITSIPFALIDAAGKDFDTSEDWQNRVGFMPRPLDLLRLWRLSLFVTNAAYGFMEQDRRTGKLLRYIMPETIEPVVDSQRGLVAHKRTLGATTTTYPVESGRIFWMYRQDWDTEILPSKATEFGALANAAGVTYWADEWANHFFRRGGIRPTMLLVKGVNPNREEREKLESVWQRFISGIGNFGKVFNADAIEPKIVGDGVGDLKDSTIYRQALENIAMASGIPLSLLLSNSANYATAQTEMMTWYNYSIAPYANWMAHEMTERLFAPLGLRFEFRPERSDPDVEQDYKRSQIFAVLVDKGVKPAAAAEIAGIELPTGWTYTDIFSAPEAPEAVEPTGDKEDNAPPVPVRAYVPTAEQVKELNFWRDLAERKARKGQPLQFDFEVRTLPDWYAGAIKARLSVASGVEDIDWAFSPAVDPPAQDAPRDYASAEAMMILADAINNAINVDVKQVEPPLPQPAPVINVTMPPITLSAQMPQLEAPDVIINLPEQPAPVVTVTNDVQPAAVTVDNQVTVQPAPVHAPAPPKNARVQRDIDGRISGITTE